MSSRTIEFVLDKNNGNTIYAEEFFKKNEAELFNYRKKLQEAIKGIKEPLFVCYFCGQKIKINGGGETKKILHFAHQKDSEFCHLKTDNKLTVSEINRMKYNGAKESPLHIETKRTIKELIELNPDFSNIKIEQILKSRNNYLEWKRPDISAGYKSFNIVFEIQLSTTFLSVIVDREHFYKENQTYIIWIFRNFEIDIFKQRFTDKDVFYSNNRNAFVIDDESINLSKKHNDLYLLCYYQKPIIKDFEIAYSWELKYVSFKELIFENFSFKVFHYDVDRAENKLKIQLSHLLKEKREEERLANEEKRKKLIEREIFQEAERLRKQNESQKILDKKKENYLSQKQQDQQSKILHFKTVNSDFYLRLETNYTSLSEFQKVFTLPITELPDSLYRLFARGYEITHKDTVFLNKEFETELLKNSKGSDMEIIYYLSISIFYIKLKKRELIFKLPKIQKVLFAILSFKKEKVIGYKFHNLKGVFNYIFTKNEFSEVLLNAVEEYYGLNRFLMEDRRGNFKSKIIEFNKKRPIQNIEYNDIIEIIFKNITTKELKLEDYIK